MLLGKSSRIYIRSQPIKIMVKTTRIGQKALLKSQNYLFNQQEKYCTLNQPSVKQGMIFSIVKDQILFLQLNRNKSSSNINCNYYHQNSLILHIFDHLYLCLAIKFIKNPLFIIIFKERNNFQSTSKMQQIWKSIGNTQKKQQNQQNQPSIRVKSPLQIFTPKNDNLPTPDISKKESQEGTFAITELIKFATEIKKEGSKSRRLENSAQVMENIPWPCEQQANIMRAFYTLFQLYIKEEILKHYCAKLNWRFQERLIKTFVTPYVEILKLNENKIQNMFEPFLKEITSIYLLYTSLDTYSRLNPSELICQMSKTWIEIRKAQIDLKSLLRAHVEQFTKYFSKQNQGSKKTSSKLDFSGLPNEFKNTFDRKKFFKYLFQGKQDKKNGRKMISLIKVFIFCHRVFGVQLNGNIESWINEE